MVTVDGGGWSRADTCTVLPVFSTLRVGRWARNGAKGLASAILATAGPVKSRLVRSLQRLQHRALQIVRLRHREQPRMIRGISGPVEDAHRPSRGPRRLEQHLPEEVVVQVVAARAGDEDAVLLEQAHRQPVVLAVSARAGR